MRGVKYPKIIFIVLSFLLLKTPPVQAIDCSNTFTGYIPLNDLGPGTYSGSMGGLYPGGLNVRPPIHDSVGLTLAKAIEPLDTLGNPDSTGKYVLVSVGMSNTTQEFSRFKAFADTFSGKDPELVIVDGAQGGWSAEKVTDSTQNETFWNNIDQRLRNAGVHPNQVVTAWLKQAMNQPQGTFPVDADSLHDFLVQIVQIMKTRFPNLKLTYISSRIYAGYATTVLNPEPYAYQSAFSVKWLIEDQINGDTILNYDLSNGPARASWFSWGPYLWADGLVPRSDGLIWECSDFGEDGTHPSPDGRVKVANLLLQFFSTDPTATPWFLGTSSPSTLFTRGDVNADGTYSISDALYILTDFFGGGPPPPCVDAGDASDDGNYTIADGLYILRDLFGGEPPPPLPFPACGVDLTDDGLGCVSFTPCNP